MTPEIKKRIAQIQQGEVPEGYQKVGVYLAPKDWKSLKIKNIYSERKEPGEEGLPILTVSIHSGVSDGELDEDEIGKAVKRIEDKSQYKKAHRGDLVFNMMRAWQGAVGAVRTTGMVSPAYIVAKPNDRVDPFYMDYYMKTPEMIHTMHSQSYGVTDFRLRLYWDSFAPISCVIPSVAEQQKISEILTTQDRVIELKEKLIVEKQRQKKYLMQQLLTGKKRLPGFSGKWIGEKLSSFCEFIGGGTPDTKNDNYWNGQIPWISSSDLNEDNFDFINITRFITKEAVNNSATKVCPKDSILVVNRVGVGKLAIAKEPICTSQDFVSLVQVRHNNVFLTYALYWFLQKKLAQVQGSAIKGIPAREFKEYELVFPSYREQTAIAEILSAADREIELLQRELEQEKQKKKALMQLMLTGIVRV